MRQRTLAPIDTTKLKSRSAMTYVQLLESFFQIPAFSLPNLWRGSSEIIKTYIYDFDFNISIHDEFFPLVPPDGTTACLTISWKPGPDKIERYKLWDRNVGEILYLPIYSGQAIGRPFTIEVWNIDPNYFILMGEGGIAVGEGGIVFNIGIGPISEPFEHLEEEVMGEGGVAVGEGGIVFGTGNSRLVGGIDGIDAILPSPITVYTTKYFVPTDKCETGIINLGNPIECVDPIFFLADFEPIFGDYYIFGPGPCERILIKGPGKKILDNKLQSTDGSWHYVWMTTTFDGTITLMVDQTPTTPGTLGYFPIRIISNGLVYKFHLNAIDDGSGVIQYPFIDGIIDNAPDASITTMVKILNQGDGNYYGLYMRLDDDNNPSYRIFPNSI